MLLRHTDVLVSPVGQIYISWDSGKALWGGCGKLGLAGGRYGINCFNVRPVATPVVCWIFVRSLMDFCETLPG
jgi:hypothetical protein